MSCESNSFTPPPANQRENVPVLSRPPWYADASALRRLFPPPLPDNINDLTPALHFKISQSLSLDPHIPHMIPCPLDKFQEWIAQHSQQELRDLRGLWEYDAENGFFIITPVSTAVHEGLSSNILYELGQNIHHYTSRVAACIKSEIRTVHPDSENRRIADIFTTVRLHPIESGKCRRSIVFEVGLTQTLGSLRERARMWLHQTQEEVHLVVVIKLLEVPPAQYVTRSGETISRSHARTKQFEWPARQYLFGGRTLEQEISLRSASHNDVADRETTVQQILCDIKVAIAEYLLQADNQGTLIPPLIEPIDATMYEYRRKGSDRVSPELNLLKGRQRVDGIAGNQQKPQAWEPGSTLELGSELQSGEEEEAEGELGSKEEDDPFSEGGDETELDLVSSVEFMHNGSLTPNLPGNSKDLTFRIAEVYGPLPIWTREIRCEHCNWMIPSDLIQTIPPSIREHAPRKIRFPLIDFVECIQRNLPKLRRARAIARADKIVDVAYLRWYEVVQAQETLGQSQ